MDIHPDVHARLRHHVLDRLAAKDHGLSDLNLHQASVHCNGAALGHDRDEAEDAHHHEHYGPGGIRNHDYADRSWHPEQIATVLIECAEMDLTCDPTEAAGPDAYDLWCTAIDNLMTPAPTIVSTAADQHLHLHPREITTWDGTTCPHGIGCEVYPRLYDVRIERHHDGHVRSHGSASVGNRSDDIARGILAARAALDFAAAVATTDTTRHHGALLPMVERAQEQLTAALTMVHPLLYPSTGNESTS